jgi:hypothetical protein
MCEMKSDLESLQAELVACDYWDFCFLRTSQRDITDTIAFVNRQRHREELIRAIRERASDGKSKFTLVSFYRTNTAFHVSGNRLPSRNQLNFGLCCVGLHSVAIAYPIIFPEAAA